MPIRTTYPQNYGTPGRVLTDFGITIETHQAYARIPATPTAVVPLLNLDSPDPLNPLQLILTGSGVNARSFLSVQGTIKSAGSDINLSGAGTIKIGFALNADASPTSANAFAATPRNSAGFLVTGTSIPRNSVFVAGGGPNTGFVAGAATGATLGFSVYGATGDTGASTALDMSSSNPARPAFVFVTIRSMIRTWLDQTVSDYPSLPLSVLEQLQTTI